MKSGKLGRGQISGSLGCLPGVWDPSGVGDTLKVSMGVTFERLLPLHVEAGERKHLRHRMVV